MKPEERENRRYKKESYCKIDFEEKKMFEMLDKYTINRNKSDISVLDIGCGSGIITKRIKDMGYRVEGVDFSKEAVVRALTNEINASVCNLDEGIKKPSNNYDIVWAGDVIEHVFDPISLMKEINRILKKEGALILCIPSDVGIVSRIKMLFGYSYQEITYKKYRCYKHHTFFNLKLISYMLKEAAFEIQEIDKILILNKKRYLVNFMPSSFYNELVIMAKK